MNLKPLVHIILREYALAWNGTHGVSHWARVLENGRRLAEETGANIQVIQLFAVFHDSRRLNEGFDDGHGQRLSVNICGKQPDEAASNHL